MAAIVKDSDGKDVMVPEPESEIPAPLPPRNPSPARGQVPVKPGRAGEFFTLYKRGQGYWTRMGTVGGAALIGLLTADFIYEEFDGFAVNKTVADFLRSVHLQEPRGAYLAVAIFVALYALVAYYLMNRPTNVDFLIATDSEMKKVNWTSRKELIGSTRIVILFMFVMALVLFIYDMFFQTVFYLINVLKTPPPFFPVKH